MMHFLFATVQGLMVKQKFLAFPKTTYYNILYPPYGIPNTVPRTTKK